jgi:hypothetical protein
MPIIGTSDRDLELYWDLILYVSVLFSGSIGFKTSATCRPFQMFCFIWIGNSTFRMVPSVPYFPVPALFIKIGLLAVSHRSAGHHGDLANTRQVRLLKGACLQEFIFFTTKLLCKDPALEKE